MKMLARTGDIRDPPKTVDSKYLSIGSSGLHARRHKQPRPNYWQMGTPPTCAGQHYAIKPFRRALISIT